MVQPQRLQSAISGIYACYCTPLSLATEAVRGKVAQGVFYIGLAADASAIFSFMLFSKKISKIIEILLEINRGSVLERLSE
jgi:hypothetical protein